MPVGGVILDVGVAALSEVDEGQEPVLDLLLVEKKAVLDGQIDREHDLHTMPFSVASHSGLKMVVVVVSTC